MRQTDLFSGRSVRPMLIGATGEAFDAPECIFELKLDGERAIAYLDKDGTELRNKRDKRMLALFPELQEIHRAVRGRCILDGEYIVMLDGKPDFPEVQRRSLMSNPFKIQLAAQKAPVTFCAFDILYLDGRDLTRLPLMERKALLERTVSESARLAVSRYIPQHGKALYARAKEQGLEGVVAKVRDSVYTMGQRTTQWIKIKNLLDGDFVVCGFIHKEQAMASLVLGQYAREGLRYMGHVTLGVSGQAFKRVQRQERLPGPPMEIPNGHGNENAVWVKPDLVCTVQYMERTKGGGMRHPVLKGLRDDKTPRECVYDAP